MSDFKMVENRKYNDGEIKYVLSRVIAGWRPEIIAKAFKRDHGDYWANREFTKKQVAYIRTTYKPAPGMVKAYQGPIPEFSRSPTPEDSPDAAAPRRSKRKQTVASYHNRSSSTQAPVSERASSPVAGPPRKRQKNQSMRDTPTHHGEASASEHASSSIAGPSLKRQETQSMRDTPTHHGSSIQGRGLPSDLPSGPSDSIDDVLGDRIPQEPFDLDASANDILANINYGTDDWGAGEGSRNLSLDPSSPGIMGPGAGPAEDSIIHNVRDLLPDFPIGSIEGNESIATGSGTNATNSAFPTPQQQQLQQLGMSDPRPPFPPGYTRTGAVAREDPYGVWYFDPHDTCQIRLGHRHDMDGGVWFNNEMLVTQSFLAMQRTQCIGFLLGVATAAERILNLDQRTYLAICGQNFDPRILMEQIADIVIGHVPEDFLDSERFQVPEVEAIRRLSETNSRLPAGQFHDVFHRRAAQYDMSGPSGNQGGGQGGGYASSSRPPRQGTGPPGARPPGARSS